MYKKSKRAFEKSNEVMPGGVNSPVRAFKSVNGDPIFIEKGKATLKGLVQSWGNFEVRTLSGLRSLAAIISSWETKNNFFCGKSFVLSSNFV